MARAGHTLERGWFFANFMPAFTVPPLRPYRWFRLVFHFLFLIFPFENWLFQRLLRILRPFRMFINSEGFVIQPNPFWFKGQRSADVRLQVTRPVLHKLTQSLSFTNSSAFQRSLFFSNVSCRLLRSFPHRWTIKSTRLASSVAQFNDLTFLSRKGHPHMAKITISVYKHNSNNRAFDILLAAEES